MILGLDIGGTNIKAGLVQKDRIIAREIFPSFSSKGARFSIEGVKQAIDYYHHKASAIGVGCAGIIDSEKGIVRFSPNFKGWQNIRLSSILARQFKKPVRLLNDVNAIMLGEWKYGAGKGFKDVFLFTLGTGVGGAAVCEGRLLYGATGFAGEFGHTTIKYDGPRCLCGRRGCLESFVSSRSIVKLARQKMISRKSRLGDYHVLTPKIIADEAKRGDAVATDVFRIIGDYIGIALSNVINLLDPKIVIISGGVARAGQILFDPIKKAVKQLVLGPTYRKLKIVPAKLGDDAGIIGAAFFAASSTSE